MNKASKENFKRVQLMAHDARINGLELNIPPKMILDLCDRLEWLERLVDYAQLEPEGGNCMFIDNKEFIKVFALKEDCNPVQFVAVKPKISDCAKLSDGDFPVETSCDRVAFRYRGRLKGFGRLFEQD